MKRRFRSQSPPLRGGVHRRIPCPPWNRLIPPDLLPPVAMEPRIEKTVGFPENSMIAMGYDDYDGEHWAIGGTRSVETLAVGIILFLVPIERSLRGIAAIVALAAETFFLAEMVKHTEMEEGFLYTAMVGATSSTRRVFGFLFHSFFDIFFHSFLPFYDKDEFFYNVPDSTLAIAEQA